MMEVYAGELDVLLPNADIEKFLKLVILLKC
jgi:hypothetical protein